MLDVLRFLEKGDGSEPKHHHVKHALVSFFLVHAAVIITGLTVEQGLSARVQWGTGSPASPALPEQPGAAVVFALYWALLIGLRLLYDTPSMAQDIYHLMFACNIAFPMAVIGLLLRRPALLCAQGVLVAIDQVLWYVDLLGYAFTGKLPLKVMGYVFWPSTPLSRKITCVHHLVFIPFVIYLCATGASVPIGRGFVISFAQTISCQLVCRYTTPLELIGAKDERLYLNINLCHEAFRDVKVQWLRRYDGAPPAIYLPWMLWIWNFGNLILFFALALVLLVPLRLMGAPGAHLSL